jgi:hypothetical protein
MYFTFLLKGSIVVSVSGPYHRKSSIQGSSTENPIASTESKYISHSFCLKITALTMLGSENKICMASHCFLLCLSMFIQKSNTVYVINHFSDFFSLQGGRL